MPVEFPRWSDEDPQKKRAHPLPQTVARLIIKFGLVRSVTLGTDSSRDLIHAKVVLRVNIIFSEALSSQRLRSSTLILVQWYPTRNLTLTKNECATR